jgi:hypothetical protein
VFRNTAVKRYPHKPMTGAICLHCGKSWSAHGYLDCGTEFDVKTRHIICPNDIVVTFEDNYHCVMKPDVYSLVFSSDDLVNTFVGRNKTNNEEK